MRDYNVKSMIIRFYEVDRLPIFDDPDTWMNFEATLDDSAMISNSYGIIFEHKPDVIGGKL